MGWLSKILSWFKKKPTPTPVIISQEKHMDKALLIGINKYPNCPLNGCVNDVNDMANFLVQQYKFNPDNIRMLTDERATTAAILER